MRARIYEKYPNVRCLTLIHVSTYHASTYLGPISSLTSQFSISLLRAHLITHNSSSASLSKHLQLLDSEAGKLGEKLVRYTNEQLETAATTCLCRGENRPIQRHDGARCVWC